MSDLRLAALGGYVEKVFWGRWTKFSRAADAFRARRCEGPRRISEKTTADFRIGATAHPNSGVVQKSAFARFLGSLEFRLFQQYRRKAAVRGVGVSNYVPR